MGITVQSYNTALGAGGPTATGGVAGAPVFPRSTVAASRVQIGIDWYTTLGTETTGSVIEWWPQLGVDDRLVYALLSWGALGSGALISLGKIDPNNSANTDAVHYLAAVGAATTGSALANVNIGEQVGQDPLGDQSTGNTAPAFGAANIILTSTITGATAAASQTIMLVYLYTSGV